jgi:ribosomal protein S14
MSPFASATLLRFSDEPQTVDVSVPAGIQYFRRAYFFGIAREEGSHFYPSEYRILYVYRVGKLRNVVAMLTLKKYGYASESCTEAGQQEGHLRKGLVSLSTRICLSYSVQR